MSRFKFAGLNLSTGVHPGATASLPRRRARHRLLTDDAERRAAV